MAKTKKNAKQAKKKAVKKTAKKSVRKAPTQKSKKKATKKVSARKTTKTAKKQPAKKKAVKKTVKKTARKPLVKSSASKKPSRKLIVAVGDQCFWIYEGPIIKDLKELAAAFREMQDYQFAHHIQEQNDFANWVEAVLRDKTCANALRKANTISESLFVLDRVLRRYI